VVGAGSTFTMRLPLAGRDLPPGPAAPAVARSSGPQPTAGSVAR
jgi:hypothetical protein